MASIRAIRGMNDVLHEETPVWQAIEKVCREVLQSYGYREIRLPVLELTELFRRSIGEVTDIVEKEMYTFEDRNGESLTLRPEATAGVVRAAISNGLIHNQRHKFWTQGPMFRREKPQRGRYRQFHQIDVEAIGFEGPDVDAEMILMPARIFKALNIKRVKLELNSLGTSESRQVYRGLLVDYFGRYTDSLDEDSQRRLHTNPLRILDSKNPALADIILEAPVLTEHLDAESRSHFDRLCELLGGAGIDLTVNPRLVRGLDYYSRTVFEWVTDALGAQGAVCSGGRYDGLTAHLGGKATPAIGWAAGVERLVELYKVSNDDGLAFAPHVYMVAVGSAAETYAFKLAEQLRSSVAGLTLEQNLGAGSFKSQLKRADKSGAALAIIIGDEELGNATVGLKPLRSGEPQLRLAEEEIAAWLTRWLANEFGAQNAD